MCRNDTVWPRSGKFTSGELYQLMGVEQGLNRHGHRVDGNCRYFSSTKVRREALEGSGVRYYIILAPAHTFAEAVPEPFGDRRGGPSLPCRSSIEYARNL